MPAISYVHPLHHTPLFLEGEKLRCPKTGDTFELFQGVPMFVPEDLNKHMHEERQGFENVLKTFLRKYPSFYIFLIFLISPVCLTGISAKKFLKRFKPDALTINVGSGAHKPSKTILNLDIFYYKGVDIVANAEHMPFADGSIDAIVCESLLEHVPNPQIIVHEMFRVLKPGGQMYIVIPFVYPFHASPNDYYRWSSSGLAKLCKEGDIEKIGVRAGASSALMGQLTTWAAIVLSLGFKPLYNVWSVLLLLVFFPIKFLDYIIGYFPTALNGAGQFYVIATKR